VLDNLSRYYPPIECFLWGATIEKAKQDMLRQMAYYKDTAQAEGFKYPAYLDGGYEISYELDMPSPLKYYVNAVFA